MSNVRDAIDSKARELREAKGPVPRREFPDLVAPESPDNPYFSHRGNETPFRVPAELFPEDKVDPTVTPGKRYPVENTLAVMSHVRSVTKNRKWLYLMGADLDPKKIRDFYKLTETAWVDQQGDTWAVWSGGGDPEFPAFEDPGGPTAPPDERDLEKVAVPPTALSAAVELDSHGMAIYRMARELEQMGLSYNQKRAAFEHLMALSDELHAEASRLELASLRSRLDEARKK
jgi:hypothetical protein